MFSTCFIERSVGKVLLFGGKSKKIPIMSNGPEAKGINGWQGNATVKGR